MSLSFTSEAKPNQGVWWLWMCVVWGTPALPL